MNLRLSYFKLPKDAQIREKWLEKISQPRIDSSSYLSGKVCELHFEPDCYKRDLEAELTGRPLRKWLKDGAVPTLYLTSEENEISNLLSENPADLQKCDTLMKMAESLRKEEPKPKLKLKNTKVMTKNNPFLTPTIEKKLFPKQPYQGPNNVTNFKNTNLAGMPTALGLLFDHGQNANEANLDANTNSNPSEVKRLKMQVAQLTSKLTIKDNMYKNLKRKFTRRESVIKKLRQNLSEIRKERRKLRQREYMRKFKQKKVAEKRKERRAWICKQILAGKLEKSSLYTVYSSKSFEKLKESASENSSITPSTNVISIVDQQKQSNIVETQSEKI